LAIAFAVAGAMGGRALRSARGGAPSKRARGRASTGTARGSLATTELAALLAEDFARSSVGTGRAAGLEDACCRETGDGLVAVDANQVIAAMIPTAPTTPSQRGRMS